jgi:hypothetical protein
MDGSQEISKSGSKKIDKKVFFLGAVLFVFLVLFFSSLPERTPISNPPEINTMIEPGIGKYEGFVGKWEITWNEGTENEVRAYVVLSNISDEGVYIVYAWGGNDNLSFEKGSFQGEVKIQQDSILLSSRNGERILLFMNPASQELSALYSNEKTKWSSYATFTKVQ